MILERGTELVRERMRRSGSSSTEVNLQAAMAWLYAAQDSSDDRGVSHSYLIGERWMRSYPETTGYIIPTLLNWSRATGEAEAERRALEMADWELGLQLESGAIPDLIAGNPVIFDTGQVMFGWIAAYRHTQTQQYLDAATRGADWLLSQLQDDGVWRSPTDSGGPGRVYNARVAWALLELFSINGDDRLRAAAQRFLEWTLEMERGDGWFDHNCLTTDATPLLHTIAYTARGQLESGLLLEDERFLDAARRTATRLVAAVRADGHLAGRFDRAWKPAVRWACLTGMAQTSIIWQRLATLGSAEGPSPAELVQAAKQVNGFITRTQDLTSSNPGLRGGIRGSFPVNGTYGQWSVLNWATKFAIDAWMMEQSPDALFHRG